MHDLQIVRLTQEKLAERNTAKRVIVPRGPMLLLDEKGSALMPVPAAAELVELGREKGRVRVLLPDGCTGTLASDQVVPTEAFEKHWDALRRGPEAVYAQAFVEMARAFLGTPYLWGGTSQAGLDCSGFVSLARRLTGLIVSRDADQQLAQARPYKFDRIEDVPPGLLFGFGKKLVDGKLRVDHIAVSLGGGDFIHSLGSVRIESLSEASPLYSAYEAGRFLGVWELPASLTGVPCATTLSSNPFYAAKPGALEPCRAPAVLDQ